MLAPAPGLFSTMTGLPNRSDSFCANNRPSTSDGPPAVCGTMMRRLWSGYADCANAGVASKAPVASSASRREIILLMGWLRSVRFRIDLKRLEEARHEVVRRDRRRELSDFPRVEVLL